MKRRTLGITQTKKGVWQVQRWFAGKVQYLGSFPTSGQAHERYLEATGQKLVDFEPREISESARKSLQLIVDCLLQKTTHPAVTLTRTPAGAHIAEAELEGELGLVRLTLEARGKPRAGS
jgi:hypothetical protein